MSASNAPSGKPASTPLSSGWEMRSTRADLGRSTAASKSFRDRWTNLNGLWEYAIVGVDSPQPTAWNGQILVPFGDRIVFPPALGKRVAVTAKCSVDRRSFEVNSIRGRLLLNFGAVDWHASCG